jgi:hypothetical protein
MPFIFIGTGLVLVFVGLQGNPAKLYALIAADFTGPNSFIYWMIAILILGALGFIPSLEKLSRLFMLLVLVVLFLDNGGFFQQFQAFVKSTTQPAKQGAQ